MTSIPNLETVTERDMDLLIMEELIASDDFLRGFALQSGVNLPENPIRIGVWHSVCDPVLGESDLVLLVQGQQERRHALLIENKIDAPPQPQQAARYRQRGESGIVRGDWDQFTTCIVAPDKYLAGIGDARLYDGCVTYEWIAQFLESGAEASQARRRFRASMILQAIEQNRRGYSPKHDERVTAFYRAYWTLLQQSFPELGMTEPVSKPTGADWIELRPPILPSGFILRHKLAAGAVDLQTPWGAFELDALAESCRNILQDDMGVQRTSSSCSIRIAVPQMDRFKDFDSQQEIAALAMKSAYRLSFLGQSLAKLSRPSGTAEGV